LLVYEYDGSVDAAVETARPAAVVLPRTVEQVADVVRIARAHDLPIVPRGAGTWGSRSLQVGGSAVVEQGQAVVAKARTLASHLLEVDEADLTEPADGRFEVTGAPERAITWGELAVAANDPSRLPEGMTPGLVAAGSFRELESTFPFGAHVSVVRSTRRPATCGRCVTWRSTTAGAS